MGGGSVGREGLARKWASCFYILTCVYKSAYLRTSISKYKVAYITRTTAARHLKDELMSGVCTYHRGRKCQLPGSAIRQNPPKVLLMCDNNLKCLMVFVLLTLTTFLIFIDRIFVQAISLFPTRVPSKNFAPCKPRVCESSPRRGMFAPAELAKHRVSYPPCARRNRN